MYEVGNPLGVFLNQHEFVVRDGDGDDDDKASKSKRRDYCYLLLLNPTKDAQIYQLDSDSEDTILI